MAHLVNDHSIYDVCLLHESGFQILRLHHLLGRFLSDKCGKDGLPHGRNLAFWLGGSTRISWLQSSLHDTVDSANLVGLHYDHSRRQSSPLCNLGLHLLVLRRWLTVNFPTPCRASLWNRVSNKKITTSISRLP